MLAWLEQLHWGAVLQIVLIDILLGGDNAVVIALACRKLERRRRLQGILWGTAGAIVLRVTLIAFALALLAVPYLKIVGAVLLLWIGIKLMQPDGDAHDSVTGATSVWSAVRTIIVADFIMSLDNVVAIAAAAQNTIADHQILYVAFGLLLSVPIIIWGSTLVLKLIDRFPLLVTFGAGLLGWIAGGMLVTDIALDPWLGQTDVPVRLIAEIAGAALVVAVGLWWSRRHTAQTQTQE
ncbi:TerC family protein [Castellaniella sp.]|uniref:TerC family protein n=1 Tax=Castellaniella sp. TaxID=1955812 RepID=UPI002AFEE42B|nr:TerC family protein [Castellaniella sp.]